MFASCTIVHSYELDCHYLCVYIIYVDYLSLLQPNTPFADVPSFYFILHSPMFYVEIPYNVLRWYLAALFFSDDISLEGLQQELEECGSDDVSKE